jgi:hypothetical protein
MVSMIGKDAGHAESIRPGALHSSDFTTFMFTHLPSFEDEPPLRQEKEVGSFRNGRKRAPICAHAHLHVGVGATWLFGRDLRRRDIELRRSR